MRTAHQSHFDYRFYDSLSRLIEADYNNGTTVYNYGYDVAGNMTNYDGVNRTYNVANQLTGDGTNTYEYDENGNLWKTNSVVSHTWDRANRLVDAGNHSYVYDGVGNRVQQTVSSVVTNYLNDVQPDLTKLLKQDDGTNIERFVHAPRGIHAVDDGTDWNVYLQDGLGSVRAVVDDLAVVQSAMSYNPYGNPMASYGAGFGFTGEQTDANGSVFLRARYYEPELGVFSALDPFEGIYGRPMSLNRYSWVEGNPIINTDPSGLTKCVDGLTQNHLPSVDSPCARQVCAEFRGFECDEVYNLCLNWCNDNPDRTFAPRRFPGDNRTVPWLRVWKDWVRGLVNNWHRETNCPELNGGNRTPTPGCPPLDIFLAEQGYITYGFSIGASAYAVLGGGGTVYRMFERSTQNNRFYLGFEGGVGAGIDLDFETQTARNFVSGVLQNGSLSLGFPLASEATLDEFSGLGLSGSANLFILSGNLGLSLDGECNNTVSGGLNISSSVLSVGGNISFEMIIPIWDNQTHFQVLDDWRQDNFNLSNIVRPAAEANNWENWWRHFSNERCLITNPSGGCYVP